MIAAAMATRNSKAPTYVDLARVGAEIARHIDPEACARLHAAVSDVHSIDASLTFTMDDHGRPSVTGECRAAVTMDCQLCADPVTLDIRADVAGVLAASDGQAQAWRSADDPEHVVVVASAQLDVVELIEDELLLNLPTRVCRDSACPKRPGMSYGEAGSGENVVGGNSDEAGSADANADIAVDRANPFHQLAVLKKRPDE